MTKEKPLAEKIVHADRFGFHFKEEDVKKAIDGAKQDLKEECDFQLKGMGVCKDMKDRINKIWETRFGRFE